MEIKEYLETLSHEHFHVVSAYMIRDNFAIVQPEVSGGCVPVCSGKGSTPNGYWVCSSGQCVWVPAT